MKTHLTPEQIIKLKEVDKILSACKKIVNPIFLSLDNKLTKAVAGKEVDNFRLLQEETDSTGNLVSQIAECKISINDLLQTT